MLAGLNETVETDETNETVFFEGKLHAIGNLNAEKVKGLGERFGNGVG